ncbi:UDP-N-acetylglucosamine 1-carboxyvinyltransferase [Candidatus Neptunochlamydia vexilliferae]|uniref:UDP-N-acetylglucosamine 1-carboxyvinyltransferase n=1 Tax=Candidatus Neptunichlamydia vexilliferae TaxID=1651774 RepID=A0ABS0AX68_9BACT|nr:UDP-N-acetylglucosamine 1-carboxyvinyltransferase [Candidatus Neptunochlamydia vexilliferae]MBF5058723.1 UDP-N-acetylglucosamine 1-carboxyvinyltransferase [Candidatus Neptunochlamydia vexilliferae]
MDRLKITGGTPLNGHVKAAGAKNAISKMLVASLLSDKKCIFTNVPNISEVETTVNLCKEIGMEVKWEKEEGRMEVITKEVKSSYVPLNFSGANRIPILMMGALLGRTKENIIVPTVGGCKIGKRPVDFHIMALEKLGAKVEYRTIKKEQAYFAHAPEGMKGAIVELPYPSVMATENAILAACRAKGQTAIRGAAMEPEVIDLILFLQKLGVVIYVDVDRTVYVRETTQFYEVEHKVITDRIEAACFGMAAIATKGRVFVEGAEQPHMVTFLNKLRRINGGFAVKENGIEFFYQGPLKGGLHLETDVHPGFLTDWQQPFVVLLTQAEGSSVVHETVYENRFGYVKALKEMGAHMELFTQCLGDRPCRFANQNYEHSLIVKGPTAFRGKEIVIPDLRAGFAYVMAALLAPEESILSGLPYLDRGYEHLEEKLQGLGANITRVKAPKEELQLSSS